MNKNGTKLLKQQIEAQIAIIADERTKLDKLEEELEEIEVMPKVRDLVGKCFKCKNSYSSTAGKNEWWMYIRVLSYNRTWIKIIQFEKSYDNAILIEFKENYYNHLDKSYIEINQKEYDKAVKDFEVEIDTLLGN